MIDIDATAEIAADADLDVDDLRVGRGAVISAGVRLRARAATIGPGTTLGVGSTFAADEIRIGADTLIDRDCHFAAISADAELVEIGDDTFFGPSVNSLLPVLRVGDFVKVHNHVLINGYKGCFVGHNTWVGQNGLLNAADDLVVGNNVSLGIGTCVFTHAFAGELLEGCTINTTAPTTIGDNVWTAGPNHMIGPGVTIGARTMILPNAVVNRSLPPASCFGGIPARDLTDVVRPFRDVSLDEKLEMLRRFVVEFAEAVHPDRHEALADGVSVTPADGSAYLVRVLESAAPEDFAPDEETLAYVGDAAGLAVEGATVFDVSTKTYTKRRTAAERELIRFMNGNRARFVPRDRPRVERGA